ncbi:hypothetical protein FISHEDRAFT_36078 [Fistulina hepatica ATCC 64428]|uniref:SnoaL-like domain-containing protein n=1 Tax=Fistulina hepatica ATCC 64428 TaxID=1128425 RepID=A0A0D7AJK8_9AGAR|nr:hypothetical protein FISHEDRAFT_36078 [Fistulina hepatica ATCC 64428]
MPSPADLLKAAEEFCTSFASGAPIDDVLSHFSTLHEPSAFEHGEPALAPFLGREFTGRVHVREYFELLAELLSYEKMSFTNFIVDSDVHGVACRGSATFTWKATGQTWDESFAYMLKFDEACKVVDYQVWADSGAAYLARIGKLDEVRNGGNQVQE